MIKGITHLLLQVRDLPAAEEFYLNFLGFTERMRGTLGDGRPLLALHEGLGLTVFPAGEQPGFRSADHIAFQVEDLQPFLDRLNDAGHPYEGPVTTPRYGHSIYLLDPEGNRLELHDGEVSAS